MTNIRVLTITKNIGTLNIIIHPVIIFNETDLVLYDACFPNQIDQINTELGKHGFSVEDITKIVISHQDHDHIGSLSELKELNGRCIVISSEIEAPYIEGKKKSLRLLQAEEYNKNLSGKELEFGIKFAEYLKTIPECNIDKLVHAGDYIIPGLKVVSTPGHTPGHISLFYEEDQTLLTGDALAFENDEFVIANPEFTMDPAGCKKSVEKIISLAPQKVICYHGGIIETGVGELLNRLIKSEGET